MLATAGVWVWRGLKKEVEDLWSQDFLQSYSLRMLEITSRRGLKTLLISLT